MAPARTQETVLQFSNTISTQYSNAEHGVNWLTEVFSSDPKAPNKIQVIESMNNSGDGEFATSSSSVSKLSTDPEMTAMPRNNGLSIVSFVNLTGAPTKDGRNKARKLATIARKREKKKKEKLQKEEQSVILEALSSTVDEKPYEPTLPTRPKHLTTRFNLIEVERIPRFGGFRSDPFMQYPFELSHRERRLMDHIFHIECGTIRPYKDAFLPVGLTDKAAFHQILANLAVQLDGHRFHGQDVAEYEKAEVLAHHTTAMAMVQKRLQDPRQATSDGTIATVIAMACYAHLTKDFRAWHSHIKGLKELLTMQGGDKSPIQKYGSLKIGFYGLDTMLGPALSWVDTNGSATQDIPPRFPLSPHISREIAEPAIIEAQLSPTTLMLYLNLLDSFPSGERIFDIFKDFAYFVSVFKARLCYSSLDMICEDSSWSWANLYPLTHDLLSYRENVDLDDYESVVKESCRLALNVLNTRIRRVFGIAPLVLDIYVDQLLPLLQNPNIPKDWSGFNEFKLWILVIGTMEARGDTRVRLVALMMEIIPRLGIRSHLELERRMRRLIWIQEIDGERFWELESELCQVWAIET